MLPSSPAPAPGLAALRAGRAGAAVVGDSQRGRQNGIALSFQAASAADLERFCPCKLPFSLLALAVLTLPGRVATLQKRRPLLQGLRNARGASRNALCANFALCREPAWKLSAWHQMLSHDSYDTVTGFVLSYNNLLPYFAYRCEPTIVPCYRLQLRVYV